VFLVLGWIFGVLSVLTGMSMMLLSFLSGLPYLVIGLLLLPPVRKFAFEKTKLIIPIKVRALTIFGLILTSAVFAGMAGNRASEENAAKQAKQEAESAETSKQQQIKSFNENSGEIIQQAQTLLDKNDFSGVLTLTSKYLAARDPQLLELNAKARKAQSEINAKEKTQKILLELKGIPDSDLAKNIDLYTQLVSLNPNSQEYQKKYDAYSQKLKKQQEKEQATRDKLEAEKNVRLAMFGKAPEKSKWDGSYLEVKSYLKEVANDPDSIEFDGCTDVYKNDNGWIVGCNYRGRNAFNAKIRQANWFTIVHGKVVKMEDISKYTQ